MTISDRPPSPIRTTNRQKLILVAFGMLLFLLIIEFGMRVTGLVLITEQRMQNQIPPSGSKVYRILALGESTTADFFVSGKANDWPRQLERILNEKSRDLKFVVYNEGIGGTNTAFILSHIEEQLEKYRPDMVITMMGINDNKWTPRFDGKRQSRLSLFFSDLRLVKLARLFIANVTDLSEPILSRSDAQPPPDIAGEYSNKSETAPSAKQGCFFTPRMRSEESHRDAISKGLDAFNEGKSAAGEAVFFSALAEHPNSSVIYAELGRMYQNKMLPKKAEVALSRAHELDPSNCQTMVNLGTTYAALGKWEACANLLEKALKMIAATRHEDEVLPRLISNLSECWENQGKSAESMQSFLEKNNLPFVLPYSHVRETTRYHYRRLYGILRNHGVLYAAMQYPTWHIEDLEKMFDDEKTDILFIENTTNFGPACSDENYAICFTDHLKPTFGHMTSFGHRLIAEQAAAAILSRLNVELN